MHVLFDLVHPAHVHFYRHVIAGLEARGHATRIVARERDILLPLLDELGLPRVVGSRAAPKRRLAQLGELLQRDWAIWREVRRFRPRIICSRSPAGMQVARLTGVTGVFDSDDGPAAGLHWHLGATPAHWITTPACQRGDFGPRHLRYPGYKQSAYLHPDHFTPDPAVLGELGVGAGEPFFLVRFVAMSASHDLGEGGLDLATREAILERLAARGRVFLSQEGGIPERWAAHRCPVPAHRLHHVLAFATLLVGDSQTMAAEAAFLGTPGLRASTFKGRLDYLEELEHRYGLTWSFHPGEAGALLAKLEELLALPDPRAPLVPKRERLLGETVNVAAWYVELLERLGRGEAPPVGVGGSPPP